MQNQEQPQTSIRVRRAIEGDPESLGWLVGHLDPLLRAQVRVRLGSRARNNADVDDIVAEVWAIALRSLPKLEPRAGRLAPVFVAFLSRTATNLCNSLLRRVIRSRRGSSPSNPAGPEPPPIEDIEDRTRGVVTRVDGLEVRAIIEKALDRLSPDRREILVLRLLEHQSNAEISSQLGVPANTIAVRYRRAMDELRQRLPPGVYEGFCDLTIDPDAEAEE